MADADVESSATGYNQCAMIILSLYYGVSPTGETSVRELYHATQVELWSIISSETTLKGSFLDGKEKW